MSSLAPLLESFFTKRLIAQRNSSPNTIAAYRDTYKLLLHFAHRRTGKTPSKLDIEDIDAELVSAFLHYLERERGNQPRTRNARLTAIRALFQYASFERPEHGALIQRVLAIPAKRTDRPELTFLSDEEVDAVLASPDRQTRLGRRDHALILLDVITGLRASELTSLTLRDVHLGDKNYVSCTGKGRKQRSTPLTKLVAVALQLWMRELGGAPGDPLFPGHRGAPLGRDAIRRIVKRHTKKAVPHCPSLAKKAVSPHSLRHTAAMRLLHAGVDTSVIALVLGHESPRTTYIYLHADLRLKEHALDRATPPNTPRGRYKPTDKLLAFLDSLQLCSPPADPRPADQARHHHPPQEAA